MTTAAHGTLRRYIVDGCRCDQCRTYRVRYQKQYLHDVNSGRPRTIPVQVVQDHLAMLIDSGMSQWAITKAAGYTSRNAIVRLLNGDTKRRVNIATARRILAVTPDSDNRPTAPRPVGPSRDRLRALAVMGWDCRRLADRLGWDHARCDAYRAGRATWIMARNEQAIADLFDQLWDTPGPSARTRAWARREGWPAPLDLEACDDPSDTTDGCAACEDITWLRSIGESDAAIAARLGYAKPQTVYDHLLRHQAVGT